MELKLGVGVAGFVGGLAGGWYLGWLNGVPGLRKRRIHWSIGIYSGSSPFELEPAPGVRNPVLTKDDVTDAPAIFVADPFMIRRDDTWYMFMEVFPEDTRQGVIALATSPDGLAWRYRRIVLREPFHMAYPYVFEWEGEHWMVPDALEPAEVRLYRASPFPTEWAYVGPLIRGVFADASPFRHGGRWWMFACSTPMEHHTLRLYHADRLTGPWSEHPMSPLITGDPRIARPGGRVLEVDGRLYRVAQDSVPEYGRQLWAFEITELTPSSYAERPVAERPVLPPGTRPWNRTGMHQMDAHPVAPGRWLACVDGRGDRWEFDPRRIRLVPGGVKRRLRRGRRG